MLRSMTSAVSGLQAHQQAMDVIANNIANVNTVGFKSSQVAFEDTFYQTIQNPTSPNGAGQGGGSNGMQIGYGSTVGSIDTNFNQGAFGSTGDPMDLYINGDGFFRVQDAEGNIYYTRMGNFEFDTNGYLVDSNGNYVTGFKESDVRAAAEYDKRYEQYLEDHMAWEEAKTGGIDPDTGLPYPIDPNTGNPIDTVTNADGTQSTVVWDEPTEPPYEFTTDAAGNQVPVAAPLPGERKYNPATGEYDVNGTVVPPVTEEDLSPIKIDNFNNYTDIAIGKDGQITALDSTTNEVVAIGQLALADIPNPSGMMAQGGGYYTLSGNSGEPTYGAPSGSTTGEIITGGLEMSNVDLSKEFTDMITIQRGFQACARIITTSDEMLQELINLKR